jgi:hypothetical protein
MKISFVSTCILDVTKYITLIFSLIILFMLYSCNSDSTTSTDKVQIAVYYFPNWGPVQDSEWGLIIDAKPQFPDHHQPKVPFWGYDDESQPSAMSRKIDAASTHGIDAFIFDWYYYDPPTDERPGGKYLYKALEEGFLQAPNNKDLKFAIMWCNHDVGLMKGEVSPETFEEMTDYIIERYFRHPSYWKVNGCPYFSIYQFFTFLKSFGDDNNLASGTIKRFRDKVKAAGFPDLHLNACLWGVKGDDLQETLNMYDVNSITSYVWMHHNQLEDFPATEYTKAGDAYFNCVESGGGHNGLEKPISTISTPYHINVTMGWDSSPRCRNSPEWMDRRDYPFGAIIKNNTPDLFKRYLIKAKELTALKPEHERIITINSWNEWGEGSYLEPDTKHGMSYLEAVKDVFSK